MPSGHGQQSSTSVWPVTSDECNRRTAVRLGTVKRGWGQPRRAGGKPASRAHWIGAPRQHSWVLRLGTAALRLTPWSTCWRCQGRPGRPGGRVNSRNAGKGRGRPRARRNLISERTGGERGRATLLLNSPGSGGLRRCWKDAEPGPGLLHFDPDMASLERRAIARRDFGQVMM